MFPSSPQKSARTSREMLLLMFLVDLRTMGLALTRAAYPGRIHFRVMQAIGHPSDGYGRFMRRWRAGDASEGVQG